MARRPRTQSTAVMVEVPDTGEPLSGASSNMSDYEILPDPEEEKVIVDEILVDYFEVVENTTGQIKKFIKYEKMASGKKLQETKNYPYPNASHVMVPYALTIVQNTAGFIKTLFNRRPLVTAESIKKEPKDIQRMKVLTKYMDILNTSKNDINVQKQMRTIASQVAKLGTCFVKIPFRKQLWSFKKSPTEQVNAVKRLGPAWVPIPRNDLLYPEGYESLQDCPWICHMTHIPRYELLQRKHDGVYPADKVDAILNEPTVELSETARNAYQSRFRTDERQELFDIGEFYKYLDVDGDGSFEDVIIHVHLPSGTVLKKQVNSMGNRMFVPFGFIQEDFSITSRGVCETVEELQEAINGVHNMRYDNMKVANMVMLAKKRIGNADPRETAHPGKIWHVADPRNDIVPIQFGEVHPSSIGEEQILQNYGQEATMMPDIRSGFADQTLKSRDTFSGQGLRLQQSQGLFDAITEGVSDSIAQSAEFTLYQLMAHKDEVMAMEVQLGRLTEEELGFLDEILSIPVEEVPLRLSFSIKTTEIDKTYEAQMQSLQMLVQIYTNWAEKISPLAFMLFGPQGEQLKAQAPDAYQNQLGIYVGSTRMMAEIMDFLGKPDKDEYLPNIAKQEALLKIMNMMSGEQAKQLEQSQKMMEARLAQQNQGVEDPAQLAASMVNPGQIRPTVAIGSGGAPGGFGAGAGGNP